MDVCVCIYRCIHMQAYIYIHTLNGTYLQCQKSLQVRSLMQVPTMEDRPEFSGCQGVMCDVYSIAMSTYFHCIIHTYIYIYKYNTYIYIYIEMCVYTHIYIYMCEFQSHWLNPYIWESKSFLLPFPFFSMVKIPWWHPVRRASRRPSRPSGRPGPPGDGGRYSTSGGSYFGRGCQGLVGPTSGIMAVVRISWDIIGYGSILIESYRYNL